MDETRTEQLLRSVRRMPLFRQLVPMEAGIGWPLPFRKDGQVYVTLLFYGYKRLAGGGASLYPPLATLSLAWRNQLPVEYVNLRFRSPALGLESDKEIGTFPHPAVADLSRGEYLRQRHELLAMYDELFHGLETGAAQPPGWHDGFARLLAALLEPALEPYYRAIAPRFLEQFVPHALAGH